MTDAAPAPILGELKRGEHAGLSTRDSSTQPEDVTKTLPISACMRATERWATGMRYRWGRGRIYHARRICTHPGFA